MNVPYDLRHFCFRRDAVTLVLFADAIESAHARHVAAAAKLDVIAAQKFILAYRISTTACTCASAHAIVVVRRHFFKLREISDARSLPTRVGQIASNRLRRNLPRHRQKTCDREFSSKPRRLAGAGSHHNGLRIDALLASS